MIIWSRWGILFLVFAPVGLFLGLNVLSPMLFPGTDDNAAVAVSVGIGLLISAAFMWVVVRLAVGKIIDKPKPVWIHTEMAEPYIDENGNEQFFKWVQPRDSNGEPMVQQPVSTLFFIPVKYWPFVLAAISLLIITIGVVGLLDGKP